MFKNFNDFIFENERGKTLEEFVEDAKKILNVDLEIQYDSREDDNEDEEEGHYVNVFVGKDLSPEHRKFSVAYGLSTPPFPDMKDLARKYPDTAFADPPSITIYENGTFQVWYDATPYPTSAHTSQEARMMMQTLNPVPLPLEKMKKEDILKIFQEFVDETMEQIR